MTGDRKDDHVHHAVRQQEQGEQGNDFDSVRFVHHALAGIDSAEVSLDVEVAGKRWACPLYINAMTGGSAGTGAINRELAIAAAETGVPIGSGSMSAYLRDPSLAPTYRVLRTENPHGFLLANVNANATPEQARRAVDLLEADALQIHLNAPQEIVMPEGDRDFGSWQSRVEQIVRAAAVPVFVKEVGFGLSRRTVDWLAGVGVAVADVSGRGGTNFARIENERRTDSPFAMLDSWGQSTAACLLEATGVTGIDVLASGGVRSPLDVARALALGARAAGVAGPFLRTLMQHDTAALVAMIRDWTTQLRLIMTILGARSPAELVRCELLITGELETFCRLRGLDPSGYARRGDR